MILCVDPDAAARDRTRAALVDAGFDADGVDSLAAVRRRLHDGAAVDCLVTEYDLPDATGLDAIRALRSQHPDAACVLFTERSLDDVDTARFGDLVAEYVRKDDGAGRDDLVDLVDHALAFRTQTAYPLPDDEAARVAALEQYAADSEALGDSIDRLTELATALFDVNAAAVGLVGAHEQEFLSCHGVSFDPIDREDTVCTYAILDAGVTVVEDVAADPRFADNEGLAADDIRFYASAPLVAPGGEAVGTFCVYHDAPRTFDERERELLGLLAEEVVDQLELRRRVRAAADGEPDE